MYPKEKVDVESLRQLLPEEIPLPSIRVLPPLPGSDPLPASLGGSKASPERLVGFPARKHTPHLPIGSPCLGHHISAGGGPPALGGNNPLGTVYLYFELRFISLPRNVGRESLSPVWRPPPLGHV